MSHELLLEVIREKLLGNILANQNKIALIVLTNPNNSLPIRSITKSAKEKDMWQMQTFDENQNPFWDDLYEDLSDALFPLMTRGFRINQVISR